MMLTYSSRNRQIDMQTFLTCNDNSKLTSVFTIVKTLTATYDHNNLDYFISSTSRIGPCFDILDSLRNKILSISGPLGCCTCEGHRANYTFPVRHISSLIIIYCTAKYLSIIVKSLMLSFSIPDDI